MKSTNVLVFVASFGQCENASAPYSLCIDSARRNGETMKQYTSNQIKNVAVAGHGGSGKTTLVEALLFKTGASDRLGTVADGNTVCDYDPEEIKRKASISLAVAPYEYRNMKINLLDCPGCLISRLACMKACRRPEACSLPFRENPA